MGWRDREWPLSRLSQGLFGPWACRLPEITVETVFAELIRNNFVTEHLLTKCRGYYRKQAWFKFDYGKEGLLHFYKPVYFLYVITLNAVFFLCSHSNRKNKHISIYCKSDSSHYEYDTLWKLFSSFQMCVSHRVCACSLAQAVFHSLQPHRL